jgi:succinate dehydrogenase / fumarate reductase cytochrome b subunit
MSIDKNLKGLTMENLLKSTIARKQVVALTGLGLCGFLLAHMAGNMLILVGPEAYNEYSYALVNNHLIYIAEIGLVALFLFHLAFATTLTLRNMGARDTRYAVMPNGDKGTDWIKRTLWPQGFVILFFVVLHLLTFKYGPEYSVTYNGIEMRDLYQLVVHTFKEPLEVVWYCAALIVLLLHVQHGFGSALQTLGVNHPRYNKAIRCASIGYGVLVIGGFLVQPLYVYFIYRG